MKSKRLNYSKLSKDDKEDLVFIYTDSRVREYLGGPLSHSSANKRAEALILKSPNLLWVVRDKKDNFVGIIELGNYHDTNDIEVSYQFNPEYWGKGYATEALTMIEKYSFEKLFLRKIIAETQNRNKKSVQLLERAKFRKSQELIRFGEDQLLFEKWNNKAMKNRFAALYWTQLKLRLLCRRYAK